MAVTQTVLLYSDKPEVRDRMRLAVGTRPAPELTLQFVDAANYRECVSLVDNYEIDLLLLDGEAQPAGGIGIARQLRDERDDCPPICVVIARPADRWLAAYAEVDATLVHPLDPVVTGQTVASLLQGSAAAAS
jgi:DNA-binding response OmpR family regulator